MKGERLEWNLLVKWLKQKNDTDFTAIEKMEIRKLSILHVFSET